MFGWRAIGALRTAGCSCITESALLSSAPCHAPSLAAEHPQGICCPHACSFPCTIAWPTRTMQHSCPTTQAGCRPTSCTASFLARVTNDTARGRDDACAALATTANDDAGSRPLQLQPCSARDCDSMVQDCDGAWRALNAMCVTAVWGSFVVELAASSVNTSRCSVGRSACCSD